MALGSGESPARISISYEPRLHQPPSRPVRGQSPGSLLVGVQGGTRGGRAFNAIFDHLAFPAQSCPSSDQSLIEVLLGFSHVFLHGATKACLSDWTQRATSFPPMQLLSSNGQLKLQLSRRSIALKLQGPECQHHSTFSGTGTRRLYFLPRAAPISLFLFEACHFTFTPLSVCFTPYGRPACSARQEGMDFPSFPGVSGWLGARRSQR